MSQSAFQLRQGRIIQAAACIAAAQVERTGNANPEHAAREAVALVDACEKAASDNSRPEPAVMNFTGSDEGLPGTSVPVPPMLPEGWELAEPKQRLALAGDDYLGDDGIVYRAGCDHLSGYSKPRWIVRRKTPTAAGAPAGGSPTPAVTWWGVWDCKKSRWVPNEKGIWVFPTAQDARSSIVFDGCDVRPFATSPQPPQNNAHVAPGCMPFPESDSKRKPTIADAKIVAPELVAMLRENSSRFNGENHPEPIQIKPDNCLSDAADLIDFLMSVASAPFSPPMPDEVRRLWEAAGTMVEIVDRRRAASASEPQGGEGGGTA